MLSLKNQSNSDFGRDIKNQVGLIQNQYEQARSQNPHYGAYKGDKQMEEYIQQRMAEERGKIQQLVTGHNGFE